MQGLDFGRGSRFARALSILALALASSLGLALASSLAHAADRPNVIVLVADDLGWADVGFRGAPIDTPQLDRIAREGVVLERFYTTPICSPTRAALMTGRDPMRLGVLYNTIMAWHNNGVHPDERFMPQAFREAGYQTAMVGKWHLGHAQQTYHPNARGFEHFYGHLHTEVGYFPPFRAQGGKDLQRNGESIDTDEYETFALANEAVRWIRSRDPARPFFLYMPFLAPHTPLEAPEALLEKYADLEDDRPSSRSTFTDRSRQMARLALQPSARPVFAAVVDALDQAIGRVLATLDDEGIAKDTLVVFLSDNGGAMYAGGGANNAPFRGGKGETFEGGIRVVSMMRWPGVIEAGARYESILSVMDLFPTLAAAAGIETGARRDLDGRDAWQAIREGRPLSLDRMLFFGAEMTVPGQYMFTAFDDDWKLVQEVVRGSLSFEVTNYLFRIADDPHERQNLAADHPDVVARLQDDIIRWRALHPIGGTPSGIVPPPGWRAPTDWATYPVAIDALQPEPAPGMTPPAMIRMMDFMHGEAGRVIYDCEPWAPIGGGLCR